jgi:hypothetical protein
LSAFASPITEGLQVEYNHFPLASVGDESAAELVGDGDSVVLFQTGNVADEGAMIGVDDFNLGAMRQVDAARR